MRHLIACVAAVAVGAAAAVAVSARRAPALPPGWAEVVVLGRDDAPIEGVALRWDEHGPPCAETNARGVARIDVAGHGEAPSVFLGGALTTLEFDKSSGSFAQKLRAPKTVLRLPNAIPFDITFIDGRDGRPLHGGRAGWPDDTLFAARDPSDATIRRLVNNWCHGWLEAEAPDGFVLPPENLKVEPIVGAFVTRQSMTIPVWPTGRLRVRVVESNGRPVVGNLSACVAFGHHESEWTRVVADADGRFELRTLPLVPRAVAHVEARRDRDHTAGADVQVVEGQSEYDVFLSLPVGRDAGRCGGSGFNRWASELRLDGDASIRLRAFRSDGSPARRVHVILRAGDDREIPYHETSVVTDDDGRASIAGVDSRRAYAAILVEHGCTYALVSVPLAPGGTTDCDLREPTGESIDLAVVDDAGRPVPFARISAETRDEREWTWFPVVDGVQDLAPRTDLDGRIVLRGLPPGVISVKAVSCGREAREDFVAGKPATLRFR